jgi:hypothetical protein
MKLSDFKFLVVGLVLTAVFASSPGFGDTYNFYFSKPKKKGGEVSDEANPTNGQEEGSEDSSGALPPRRNAEQAPIIINNNNHLNPNATNPSLLGSGDGPNPNLIPSSTHGAAALPVAPPPVVAAPVPAPAPLPVAPAPNVQGLGPAASNETTVQTPQRYLSRLRFGMTGVYFPKKEYTTNWFNTGRSSMSSPSYDPFADQKDNYRTYGGMMSLGFVFSPMFTLNAFGGAHHATKEKKTLAMVGLDAEFYPFSAAVPPWDVNPVELGLLAGGSTSLGTDGDFGALHAGARLNLNFSPRFGITAIGRVSWSYLMTEVGFVTRL